MRWVFRLFSIIVIAVLVAVAGLLLLPGDKIAKIAADQVKAHTGRDLVFDGDVSVTLWPVLGVETGPVTFGNAGWAGSEPMLRAQGLSIGISAPDLLKGNIRVQRIVAVSPVLRLMTRADGRGNWEFGEVSEGEDTGVESSAGGAVPLTLERLTLTDAQLTYIEAGAEPVLIDDLDLTLLWPSASGPADIVVTIRPAGDPVTLAANIGGFKGFLEGSVAPISARLTVAGGELDFLGRASLTGDTAGHITLNTTNTARMAAALGLAGLDLPRGLGRALKIDGDVTYTTDGRLSLRALSLMLDGNKLNGAVDVVLSDPPQITAQFTAGDLDFSALTEGDADTATPSAASGAGWSKDPIDASGLAAFNGSISLNANSLDVGVARLGSTQVTVRVDRSRAVFELTKVSAYGGTLAGQLVANNRNGLSVGGDLRAVNIELKDALGELAGFDRLQGLADTQIRFLGSGASVDAIMRSLSGQGALKMDKGVIAGFDLDKLIRSGQSTGGTTVFDQLTASYVINGGNLVNKDLYLKVSKIQADGAGRIGLGDQDIDYLFTPVVARSDGKQGLSVPVRIRGPWADPKIRPDFGAALDVERQQLEDDAKALAQSKLEAELEFTVGEDEDLEDALQDRLEDEVKNQLLRLLGQD